MGIGDRHRHKDIGFVTGIAKHQPLVSSPLVEINPRTNIDPLGDICGLFIDRGYNCT